MKGIVLVCLLLLLSTNAQSQNCNVHVKEITPAKRFSIKQDGTVIDKRTGLMWMRCILGQRWNGETCRQPKPWYTHRTWAQAMKDASNEKFAKYDDWRLPTVEELRTIVETRCELPTINLKVFPGVPPASHWTIDSYEKNHDYAWRISFKNGKENADIKENVSYVARLVRGKMKPLQQVSAQKMAVPGSTVQMDTEALKKQRRQHQKLWRDDIHDLTNPGMVMLQNPAESMAGFSHNSWGRVDWMKALRTGEIKPKSGRYSNKPMTLLDMDIIMKDTSEMPYVRFPHKPHTQWLTCSNCHPKPFPYKAGVVDFSMDDVLVGKSCGLCHGKVAFSPMLCDKCHSVKQK